MKRILIAAMLMLSIVTNLYASEKQIKEACSSIFDSTARLKCYDAAFALVTNNSAENVGQTPNIIFSDASEAVIVEIIQVLFNEKAVSKEKIYKHYLDAAYKMGKRIVYFEIKITNNKFDGELTVYNSSFKLESASGETFSPTSSKDGFSVGKINRGKSMRGGVAFEIYPESIPSVFRYNTGLRSSMGNLEAISPDLAKIIGLSK